MIRFALIVVALAASQNAHGATSGAAPVCDKAGKTVAYRPCQSAKQCDAIARDCPPPPKPKGPIAEPSN